MRSGRPTVLAPGFDHGVFNRTRGVLISTCRPSLMSRLLSLANHLGMRCLLESFVALGGGSKSRLGVPGLRVRKLVGAERVSDEPVYQPLLQMSRGIHIFKSG
jgi:hypothetical protein